MTKTPDTTPPARKRGRKPVPVQLQIRLTRRLRDDLRRVAAMEGRSMTFMAAALIQAGIEQRRIYAVPGNHDAANTEGEKP